MLRPDWRTELVEVMGYPGILRDLRYLRMRVSKHEVTVDMMNALQLTVIAKCDIIGWFFWPAAAAAAYGVKVYASFIDDILPGYFPVRYCAAAQGDDEDAVTIGFLHGADVG